MMIPGFELQAGGIGRIDLHQHVWQPHLPRAVERVAPSNTHVTFVPSHHNRWIFENAPHFHALGQSIDAF